MAEADECCNLVSRGPNNNNDNEEFAYRHGLSIQGYDHEFIPPLDPKYECPICLLCQRDPIQTSCGHRFCKNCILTWIRSDKNRCPEDNSPLTENDLFPDNYAKREILLLYIRCPNSSEGCNETLALGKVEDHIKICEYQCVPCPNDCSLTILRSDVESHCKEDCLQRIIFCTLCYADFPLKNQQDHFKNCPMVTIACDLCEAMMPRQHLQPHMELDCPNVMVKCPFYEIGCKEKMNRMNLKTHEESNTHQHLQMLTDAFRAFQFTVGSFIQKGDHSRPNSMVFSKERLSGEIKQSTSEKPVMNNTTDEFTEDSKVFAEDVFNMKYDDEKSSLVSGIIDNNLNSFEKLDNDALQKKFSWAVPPSNDRIRDLYQRNVQLEQKAREQELKLDALRLQVLNGEKRNLELVDKLNTLEMRFCNGMYLWHVNDFSRLSTEAARGHNRVLHSPGFYTSCFGYKVCLRLNIQGRSKLFVSLFIHLMQGEYDNMLNWPFMGKITLTILDQEERTDTKTDITETMLTKPGLTAFCRPTTERNPKGFGYTEFVSLDTLHSGPYVKNDQLIIRAVFST